MNKLLFGRKDVKKDWKDCESRAVLPEPLPEVIRKFQISSETETEVPNLLPELDARPFTRSAYFRISKNSTILQEKSPHFRKSPTIYNFHNPQLPDCGMSG